MSKILLGVSTLLIAAAAVFGFLSRSKMTDLRGENETLSSQVSSAQSRAAKAEDERKAAADQLAAANVKAEAAAADAASARADVERARADVTRLQGELANRAATPGTVNLEGTPPPPVTGPDAEATARVEAALKDAQAKLAEMEQVNQSLVGRAQEAESRAEELQQKEKQRQGRIVAKGLQGTVLAFDTRYNFVVVNIGDRQGVVPNVEMVLTRGGQAIGRVRVTSVDVSTSIADVIAGSLARGVRVQPGDRVIFPGA